MIRFLGPSGTGPLCISCSAYNLACGTGTSRLGGESSHFLKKRLGRTDMLHYHVRGNQVKSVVGERQRIPEALDSVCKKRVFQQRAVYVHANKKRTLLYQIALPGRRHRPVRKDLSSTSNVEPSITRFESLS